LKALSTGFFLLLTLCLAAQKEVTFKVKKPTEESTQVENKLDGFFLNQYTFVQPKMADDFLNAVDSIEAGKSIARFISSTVPDYDTIVSTNLKTEVRGSYLVVTAPDRPGKGEVRLLKKRPTGEYAIVYRRYIRVVTAQPSRM
jgi:hypothetical protein